MCIQICSKLKEDYTARAIYIGYRNFERSSSFLLGGEDSMHSLDEDSEEPLMMTSPSTCTDLVTHKDIPALRVSLTVSYDLLSLRTSVPFNQP